MIRPVARGADRGRGYGVSRLFSVQSSPLVYTGVALIVQPCQISPDTVFGSWGNRRRCMLVK